MAALSWTDVRSRATAFARDWKGVSSERAESQTFWNEFFSIFGVQRRRMKIVFEKAAQRFGKKSRGRIDVFWPGMLLAEHKSLGGDLDAAYVQATDYFAGIEDEELPKFVIVSDFKRFRLYDLDDGTQTEFALAELPRRIHLFGFIAGFGKTRIHEEPEVNIRAVEKLGLLHDALKENRYGLGADGHAGHPLQLFLVRLLFCLFADDTGLFSPKDSFQDLIESTREDGADTGTVIARLFDALNTPSSERQTSSADLFAAFPYINGRLFEEPLPIPEFDARMRQLLVACCELQWSGISPAIFGAMFQKIIELDAKDRRRQLGAHYTSEANILKVIGPLFLEQLRAEFDSVRNHKEQLFAFHKKLPTITFLDPACGCGNFLVITYRELRRLELDVLEAAAKFGHAASSVFDLFKVRLDQFYGIELEEFPAQIAQVAMWLTEHQMNIEAGRAFGEFFRHLPLTESAQIRQGNALELDWEAFIPPAKLHYILGNPPFRGKQYQSPEQKTDLASIAGKMASAGVLDYVAGWFLKAAQYISGAKEASLHPDKARFEDTRFSGQSALNSLKKKAPEASGAIEDIFVAFERETDVARAKIRCAFVSTNSITQGEQVGVLWSELLRRGISIHFAHRAFKWTNEAPGKAAVHCVIIGFGRTPVTAPRLFDYPNADGQPLERAAENINPYLADAPDVLLGKRRQPICRVPPMAFGSMPNDGGHLIMSEEEKATFLKCEPSAAPYLKQLLGADEFLNGGGRWCLWLVDIPPDQLMAMPFVRARVEGVRKHRLDSKRSETNKLAATPTLFGEMRQPDADYLAIPEVSSERREYIPIGFLSKDVIATNKLYTVKGAGLYEFGVLHSAMHMAWIRSVAGRLKSDFQYSAGIVYNNLPWPVELDASHRAAVEAAACAVLKARSGHGAATLSVLYDPSLMPPDLRRAHTTLDRAVEAAFRADGGSKTYHSEAERLAFLLRRFASLTSLI